MRQAALDEKNRQAREVALVQKRQQHAAAEQEAALRAQLRAQREAAKAEAKRERDENERKATFAALAAAAPTTEASAQYARPADITLDVRLGAGGFGEVWKGKWRGATIAVKRLLAPLTPELTKELEEEGEPMARLVLSWSWQMVAACVRAGRQEAAVRGQERTVADEPRPTGAR